MKSKGKVLVVGLGFVGQANAIALIKSGYDVYGFDINHIKNIYKNPAFNLIKRINKDALPHGVCYMNKTPVLVCVNAKSTTRYPFQNLNDVKSAVATARKLTSGVLILKTTLLPNNLKNIDFDIYVPDFLHEKYAIEECLNPKWLVLGLRKRNIQLPNFILEDKNKVPRENIFIGKPAEASFIKYISNSYNALHITFVNNLGDIILGEKMNPSKVIDFFFKKQSYLRYGQSFAGHCLPKDLQAISRFYKSSFLKSVLEANDKHKESKNTLKRFFSKNA